MDKTRWNAQFGLAHSSGERDPTGAISDKFFLQFLELFMRESFKTLEQNETEIVCFAPRALAAYLQGNTFRNETYESLVQIHERIRHFTRPPGFEKCGSGAFCDNCETTHSGAFKCCLH